MSTERAFIMKLCLNGTLDLNKVSVNIVGNICSFSNMTSQNVNKKNEQSYTVWTEVEVILTLNQIFKYMCIHEEWSSPLSTPPLPSPCPSLG